MFVVLGEAVCCYLNRVLHVVRFWRIKAFVAAGFRRMEELMLFASQMALCRPPPLREAPARREAGYKVEVSDIDKQFAKQLESHQRYFAPGFGHILLVMEPCAFCGHQASLACRDCGRVFCIVKCGSRQPDMALCPDVLSCAVAQAKVANSSSESSE